MKFTIIETGGKQYLVRPGDKIKIEKTAGDPKAEEEISFDKVLLSGEGKTLKIGTPFLSNEKVVGKVIKVGKGKKVDVVRFRQKSRYFKLRGHRQPFVEVEIK